MLVPIPQKDREGPIGLILAGLCCMVVVWGKGCYPS